MPSAIQVADWLIDYCADGLGEPLDAMSLAKHLYYAQSFHLALRNQPIFTEDFQAWRRGPVIRSVWDLYSGAAPIERPSRVQFFLRRSAPALVALPGETAALLRDTVKLLSSCSPFALSDATHQEAPWREARGDLSADSKSSRPISKETMRSYYSALIVEGEDALSAHALLNDVPDPQWGWFYIAGICARRMTAHPLYVKGKSYWSNNKLWDKPEEPDYPLHLYPKPPKSRISDQTFEANSVEELRCELRRISS